MNRLAQLGAAVENVGNHELPRSSPVSLQAEWAGSLACSRERNFHIPASADYQLTFNIYDAATNGALVWGPQIFDGQTAQGHGPRIPVVQGCRASEGDAVRSTYLDRRHGVPFPGVMPCSNILSWQWGFGDCGSPIADMGAWGAASA